jgi:mannitol/fructose-specific phosphotransferase system IIA component (Ntr-type)
MSLFVPNDNNEMHIELLSKIASLLDNKYFEKKYAQQILQAML